MSKLRVTPWRKRRRVDEMTTFFPTVEYPDVGYVLRVLSEKG